VGERLAFLCVGVIRVCTRIVRVNACVCVVPSKKNPRPFWVTCFWGGKWVHVTKQLYDWSSFPFFLWPLCSVFLPHLSSRPRHDLEFFSLSSHLNLFVALLVSLSSLSTFPRNRRKKTYTEHCLSCHLCMCLWRCTQDGYIIFLCLRFVTLFLGSS